jgi:heme-degrading monooxygenase HmoA
VPATLINAFEVPPDGDERFIAGARNFLAAREGFAASALYRALRDDVDFRFVNVARLDSPQEGIADPDLPRGEMPFKAHASLYEIVHEEGDLDGEGGVVLINPFEVPAGADAGFMSGWGRAREMLAQQRGYLGTRLHRSLAPRADFRFVNIARWSSPLMFSRAIQQPAFADAAAAMPFASHPALYQVIPG